MLICYADDTLLMLFAKSIETANVVLRDVVKRLKELGFIISPGKTEAVLFGGSRLLDTDVNLAPNFKKLKKWFIL